MLNFALQNYIQTYLHIERVGDPVFYTRASHTQSKILQTTKKRKNLT